MFSRSDAKAFPSSGGTCPLRCFDVQPLAPIRAHRSTFCRALEDPGAFPAMDHLDHLSDQPSAAPRNLGAAPCVVFAFTHQSAAALVLLPPHREGMWPVHPKLLAISVSPA